jgi:hypothetical protein
MAPCRFGASRRDGYFCSRTGWGFETISITLRVLV